MVDTEQSVTLEMLKDFLADNPDIFAREPALLAYLQLDDSPEGTISLAQKQREQMQSRNRQLQEQLDALLENAHSNSDLQQRIHHLSLRLMDCTRSDELIESLVSELQAEFRADAVALRVFCHDQFKPTIPEKLANVSCLHPDDASLKGFDHMLTRTEPVCGRLTHEQKTLLFDDNADKVASVACLPLGHTPCAGILAIASHDANRFHADMGTEYLRYLGEVFMRMLRLLNHNDDG